MNYWHGKMQTVLSIRNLLSVTKGRYCGFFIEDSATRLHR